MRARATESFPFVFLLPVALRQPLWYGESKEQERREQAWKSNGSLRCRPWNGIF